MKIRSLFCLDCCICENYFKITGNITKQAGLSTLTSRLEKHEKFGALNGVADIKADKTLKWESPSVLCVDL